MLHVNEQLRVDWESAESHIFSNTANKELPPSILLENPLPEHLWVATSGTIGLGAQKFAGLSKQAFLVSATAVNQRLEITSKSRYLNVLPDFHVAGLATSARMHLSKGTLIDGKKKGRYDFETFLFHLENSSPTHLSLVPAQVFDIVKNQIKCPISMQAVLVGGAAIDQTLLDQAKILGWQLLPSYAMTECCSTIAISSTFNEHRLRPLAHMNLKTGDDGKLQIKSAALLTAYCIHSEIIDPKKEGWLMTEDVVDLSQDELRILGRGADFIKIGGEGVNLADLKKTFYSIALSLGMQNDCALVAVDDGRLGNCLHAAFTFASEQQQQIIDAFNKAVMPYEKIRAAHLIKEIPRTSLGKIQEAKLKALCSNN